MLNPPPILNWLIISQIYTSHFLSLQDYNLEDPFWRGLYRKIKTRMATWATKSFLTIHGRVQLAKLICYGIPRYWVQSMCPPPWFNNELNEDVAELIWDREIEFDPEEDGSTKDTRRWIKNPQSTSLVVSTRKEKALD
jgi:hypothetical protein